MEASIMYTLRNKDVPLMEFILQTSFVEAFGERQEKYELHITQVYEEHRRLLPYDLRQPSEAKLLSWLSHRKAPKNRRFVNQILRSIDDDSNPLRYVDISHALSLNDALWITKETEAPRWTDVNLYHHPFDEILSYVAFTGHSKKVFGVISSPELTSSGMLKKCWSNRPDGIYLLKGDDFSRRTDGRSQAAMEFYAAQIAKEMGLCHIAYDLEEFSHHDGEREIICTCKLFTTEDIGFVSAYDYFRDCGIDVDRENLSQLDIQERLAYAYGLAAYQDMMVFDAVICNQDRHLGNLGYLIDNNTGQYIKPAPLFDNGLSLLVGAARQELGDIDGYLASIDGKYLSFDTAARIFTVDRHLPDLRSLLTFEFQRHPKYNIEEATLNKMSYMIQKRAQKIISLYHDREQEKTAEYSR